MTTTTSRRTTHDAPPGGGATTGRLLTAAALAGPFFVVSSTIQALARDGFDIRVHPLSQLATGGPGWIQMVTFVVAGLGGLSLAVGHRRVVTTGAGARVAPVFLVVFGVAFVVAGLVPMDPQNGLPVGAPEGAVAMSWHSVVHGTAAAVSFTALAVACVALVVRAIRARRVWAVLGNGVVAVVLLVPVSATNASIQVAATGLVAFTWMTVTALRLRRPV
ncbi:DUF998 domain-containing protein [Occultella glacieicola]|uniref:DUF998 domain-containing protein n=1 Tax=Occultella glacieicola TaxID=2518684 RepID=A0ABY2E8H2_9MICO|nr:DUF998 domain-containing protein [Occultella glacieicola]TDE97287.1 DUF998 domain-containing protein [Occultella glacieicola]